MWNTGLNKIGSLLADAINILDGEDQSLAISVGPKEISDFKSVIFPWCNSSAEVKEKAFRVKNLRTGSYIAYLFQEYETNHTCWSPYGEDPWGQRKRLNDGAESGNFLDAFGAVDIVIQPDRVWGAPSTSQNRLSPQILDTTLAVIGLAVGILGVSAAGAAGSKTAE